MKQGQTYHELNCTCGFCKMGDTRHPDNLDPIQNNCVYGYVLPDRCRYMKHLGCNCGAYPPIVDSKEQLNLLKSLKEVELKLNSGYVGGMTEYWGRRRSHLLKKIQEVQMRDWNL